ncbi:MAG: hypothetical protein ABI903_10240 [Actinomycetota bacterium]
MYDPDVATSQEPPEELAPTEVLRYVLANSGADRSATLTITEEWANANSVTSLWADYETIARRANEDRCAALVASSGLTPTQAAAVDTSEVSGPLTAAFPDAESRGLDLNRAVPALVQGRTLSSADDVAAVIHGRVSKWIESSGDRRPAGRIVGLLPTARGVTDPDMVLALEDRRKLLGQRTRTFSLAALEQRQPWTLELGRPSADPARPEEWLSRLDTVAA